MALRSTQGQNRAVRSTQGEMGCHHHYTVSTCFMLISARLLHSHIGRGASP